jgi:prolyl 4-hydroxylase
MKNAIIGLLLLGILWLFSVSREAFSTSKECHSPRVIDSFLTQEECHGVIKAALAQGLERSEVWIGGEDPETHSEVSRERTSCQVFLDHRLPEVEPILAKAEKFLGIPRSRFESHLQVVRYKPGQEYEDHYDSDDETPVEKRRTDTLLMYLNDVESGGHTSFPKVQVEVTPRAGRAVHWKNVDEVGEVLPCALHGGLPVLSGEKWICTVWAT